MLRSGLIRARGYVAGGYWNASSGFVQTLQGAPFRVSLLMDGDDLSLTWTGGEPPYQVQQRTEFGAAGRWDNLGEPTFTNSVRIPRGPANLFLRVQGQ